MRLRALTLLTVWSAGAGADIGVSLDAKTGLRTWQTDNRGIQVRLTQIIQAIRELLRK